MPRLAARGGAGAETARFWRWYFLAGGIWNVLAGGVFSTLPDHAFPVLTDHPGDGASWFVLQLLCLAIVFFGVGYVVVGLDIRKNHAFVGVGAVAKVSLFALTAYGYGRGVCTLPMLVLTTGDLAWALAFSAFLWSWRGNGPTAQAGLGG